MSENLRNRLNGMKTNNLVKFRCCLTSLRGKSDDRLQNINGLFTIRADLTFEQRHNRTASFYLRCNQSAEALHFFRSRLASQVRIIDCRTLSAFCGLHTGLPCGPDAGAEAHPDGRVLPALQPVGGERGASAVGAGGRGAQQGPQKLRPFVSRPTERSSAREGRVAKMRLIPLNLGDFRVIAAPEQPANWTGNICGAWGAVAGVESVGVRWHLV